MNDFKPCFFSVLFFLTVSLIGAAQSDFSSSNSAAIKSSKSQSYRLTKVELEEEKALLQEYKDLIEGDDSASAELSKIVKQIQSLNDSIQKIDKLLKNPISRVETGQQAANSPSAPLDSPQTKYQNATGKPQKFLPYLPVAPRDVLWSKVVWEYIDLDQKRNLPLYFPTDTIEVTNRKSLFLTLMEGIKKGKITKVYDDSFFNNSIKLPEIQERISVTRDIISDEDEEEEVQKKETLFIKSNHIEGYQIKGMWFIDKRHGTLSYRLIAIAPMGPDPKIKFSQNSDDLLGQDSDELSAKAKYNESIDYFWIDYADARRVLHEAYVYNEKNPEAKISFDQLLTARKFSTVIWREGNTYGNREIKDYIKGNAMDRLLESERIKEEIRNKELDMWSSY
jgi:gliding motility associated protien GldN